MKFEINLPQRLAKMRAHTATHLLHSEISKFISNTQQAGSYVDQDYLRFDFQTDRSLTDSELNIIEKNINQIIYLALTVSCSEMWLKEAQGLWAKAFFEDKYGDVVRVVSVLDWEKTISIELCWWTHVSNTKDIGIFKIVSQEAVASGIKRIVAYTGTKVFSEYIQEQEGLINSRTQKVNVPVRQFWDKLDKILSDFKEINNKYESLENNLVYAEIKQLFEKSHTTWAFEKVLKIPTDSFLLDVNFKTIIFVAKKFVTTNLLIYTPNWSFAILWAFHNSAKHIAQSIWLKWWWNDELFQGKDTKVLNF